MRSGYEAAKQRVMLFCCRCLQEITQGQAREINGGRQGEGRKPRFDGFERGVNEAVFDLETHRPHIPFGFEQEPHVLNTAICAFGVERLQQIGGDLLFHFCDIQFAGQIADQLFGGESPAVEIKIRGHA